MCSKDLKTNQTGGNYTNLTTVKRWHQDNNSCSEWSQSVGTQSRGVRQLLSLLCRTLLSASSSTLDASKLPPSAAYAQQYRTGHYSIANHSSVFQLKLHELSISIFLQCIKPKALLLNKLCSTPLSGRNYNTQSGNAVGLFYQSRDHYTNQCKMQTFTCINW